jgi:hypothetical protein
MASHRWASDRGLVVSDLSAMNRGLLGLVAVLSLVAACSSSHPAAKRVAPPPLRTRPAVNAPALRAYAGTIDTYSAHVDAISKELRGCASPIARCQADAAAARTVAANLSAQLQTADEFREEGSSAPLAPGISPLLIKMEGDARAVKKAARSVSAHSGKLAITRLTKEVSTLAADVDEWEPGGFASKAIAAVHVSVPTAAASP